MSGAFVLSLLHAIIPNHWIPLVAIGRGEHWSRRETLGVTVIAGGAHILGTIIIGIIIGLVGIGISSTYEFFMEIISPIILVILGFVFIWIDRKGSHHHAEMELNGTSKKSKVAIITSLSSAMFFSPCLEIEAYYFTAGTFGWSAILGVSVIYLVITLGGMLLLVYLGFRGLERLRWTYLERHEKQVTGIVLIVLGVITYMAKLH
jgi:hypothetical protein